MVAGPLLFVSLLFASYFLLNDPDIIHNVDRYRNVEAALGFGEIAGLGLLAVARVRYSHLKNGYHVRIFERLLLDNGWLPIQTYDIDKVAGILLGAGSSYEQYFAFRGTRNGQPFSCLIFQYNTFDSKDRRFVCLSFRLPKAFPMIVIDNKLNDNGYRRHDSNLPDRIPHGTAVRLEGDFDNFYHVSTVKNDERAAVQVMSPDFMAALEDVASNKVDIEISGQDLYLIYEADFYSEQNISALFGTADIALDYLSDLSETWGGSAYEQAATAQAAAATRHKLIYKNDYLSAVGALVMFILLIALMVSNFLQ